MRKVTTRYETLIRHDEKGAFKGGHHIDIVRFLPEKGEAPGDMPPPRTTDALPLTFEEMAAYLAEDAASALAGFSELKGKELEARTALEKAQAYIAQSDAKMLEMAERLDAAERSASDRQSWPD